MKRWRAVGLVLSLIGLVDAIYLLSEELNPQIPLYCPTTGVVNCGSVTTSAYSHFLGIPVALLGVLFFAAMLVLIAIDNPILDYLLVPLWASGVAFAGYLIYVEIVVLGAICPYCTLAHGLAMLLAVPAIKLTLEPGE